MAIDFKNNYQNNARFYTWLKNVSGSRRLAPGTDKMLMSMYNKNLYEDDYEPDDYEPEELFGKRLKHEIYTEKIDTLKDLLRCMFSFETKYQGKDMVITMSNNGDKFYGLDSGTIENGKLVMQLSEYDEPAQPVPVGWFVNATLHEIEPSDTEAAYKKLNDGMLYEFACNGQTMQITEIALDQLRDPDSPEIFYFLHLNMKKSGKVGDHISVESNQAPRTGKQLRTEIERMSEKANRSSLIDQPVIFKIPSLIDPSEPEDLPDEIKGLACVACTLDYVSEFNNHIKVFMMRLDPRKDIDWVMSDKQCSIGNIIETIENKAPEKELFFMYNNKPYAISSIEAPAGKPISIILDKWESIDKSKGHPLYRNEILQWAKMCERNILDWPV